MCGDPHPGRTVGDRGVDLPDVVQVRLLAVLAARGQHGPLGGVVQARQARVVELQVAAAQRGECADLVGVRGGQVGPELVEVGVDAAVDGGGPAPEEDHVRRRQGHLRHRRAHLPGQEPVVVGEDRLIEVQRLADGEPGGDELAGALVVAELHHDLVVGAGDAAELVDEVHVPRRAAELPVGRRAQSDVLLQRDDVADRVVLDRAQAGGVDAALREVVTGLHQRPRAQQAADVVGPERRLGAGIHGRAT